MSTPAERSRIGDLRRAVWRTVDELVELRTKRLSSVYTPRTYKAIDESIAALVRAYVLPVVPFEVRIQPTAEEVGKPSEEQAVSGRS